MRKKENSLEKRLKEIGSISLALIGEFKREPKYIKVYDKLVKINGLAHEIYDSLKEKG